MQQVDYSQDDMTYKQNAWFSAIFTITVRQGCTEAFAGTLFTGTKQSCTESLYSSFAFFLADATFSEQLRFLKLLTNGVSAYPVLFSLFRGIPWP